MWDKSKWDELSVSWEEAGPPATPSVHDVENFSDLIKGFIRPDSHVLLFGCTPALRRMLARDFQSCEVVCVDYSHKMYQRTSELITSKNPREKFVPGNWLNLDLEPAHFTVALGDKIIDNVSPADWEQLFKIIHYHLEDAGCFVVHMAIASTTFKNVTVETALDSWSQKYAAGSVDLNTAAAGFWEDLLTASAFAGGGYYNTVRIDRFDVDLNQAYAASHYMASDDPRRLILESFKNIFASSWQREWSSYQLEDIQKIMGDLFVLDKIVYSNDYEVAMWQPIGRFIKS